MAAFEEWGLSPAERTSQIRSLTTGHHPPSPPEAASTILSAAPDPANTRISSARLFRQSVSIVTPILLILLWELGARSAWIDVRFFPRPSAIAAELIDLFQQGAIWQHIGATLSRIGWGFVFGAVPGVIIGLLMGISPLIRAAVQPLINATFPIPKIVVLPLFLLIFGLGEASKIAVIAVSVFYLVLINTVTGVLYIPRIYLAVGRNFQASPWLIFRDIALPGALPSIFSGLKTGMGVALLVIVSAEFLGANSGLGHFVWSAWSVFDLLQMYAGLVIISILGILTTFGFSFLEKLLIRWKT
jgi:NitT/TauT family transport system permease protein